MKTKTGIVKIAAKTGGIQFEDETDWYNPTPAAKAYVKPSLKGQAVTLKLVPDKDKLFSFVSIAEDTDEMMPDPEMAEAKKYSKEPVEGKSEYWKAKEERDIQRDIRIGRQEAFKAALTLVEIAIKAGSTSFQPADANKGFTTSNIRALVEVEAENILKFTNGGH